MFSQVNSSLPSAKYTISIVTTAIVVTTISLSCSLFVAFKLVKNESLKAELEFVSGVAAELVLHGDKSSEQITAVFESLHNSGLAPCSEQSMALMRSLALRFSEIQLVGFRIKEGIACSSMGLHKKPLPLEVPDFVWQKDMDIYRLHEFYSIAPGLKMTVAEKYDYVVAVLPDTSVDIMLTQTDLALGIYGAAAGMALTGRGSVDATWMRHLGAANYVGFSDGRNIVALQRSPRNDFIAYAAVPIDRLYSRMGRLAYLFVPVCLIVCALFIVALTHMAKRYRSPKASLHGALKKNELFVVYQPIVDLRTRRWVGAEALVRWRRADGTLVGPDFFIPIAEEHRLIQKITKRVISIVFRDAPDLLRLDPDFHVSINLSSADLQSEDLAAELQKELHITGLPPSFLHLEATERGFVNTTTGRKVIRDIRAMGVAVAIDDFGTGYSSLSYLEAFELDYLKIDKAFISAFVNEQGEINPDSQMTLHIIDIAKSMQLGIIAEGVEREVQAAELTRRGVEFAQGWLFGKPMSIGEVIVNLVGFQSQEKIARN